MGTNAIGNTEWERNFDPKTEKPYPRTEAQRQKNIAIAKEERPRAAPQPDPDVEAMAAEHSRLLDHFETWARDHSADATAETWAIIYCSRAALATYRASREQENTR